jgi:type II secretory pathway component GspD/PulD (secretin)
LPVRSIIKQIIDRRSSGRVRIAFTKTYSNDTIDQIAEQAGLNNGELNYYNISETDGLLILRNPLEKDMAYNSNLNFSSDLFSELTFHLKDGQWYSNSNLDGSSYNSATNATFDKGVLVRFGSISFVAWFEDED